MNLKEVKELVRKVQDKGEEKYKNFDTTLIRVLNGPYKWATFSTEDSYLDYYRGKVASTEKFTDVFQLELTTVFY